MCENVMPKIHRKQLSSQLFCLQVWSELLLHAGRAGRDIAALQAPV